MRVSNTLQGDALADVLRKIINGRVDFADNIYCRRLEVVAGGTPNVDFTVQHGLGKIPLGYIANPASSAVIYDGADRADWTENTMTLRSSVAGVTIHLIVV